jgi:hypothetical protein
VVLDHVGAEEEEEEEEEEADASSVLRLRRIAERDEAVGSRPVAFFWTSGEEGCHTLDNSISRILSLVDPFLAPSRCGVNCLARGAMGRLFVV